MVTFTVPLSLNILIPGWSNQTPKLNFDDVMGELGPEINIPILEQYKDKRTITLARPLMLNAYNTQPTHL
ncbi:hypothetical protein M8J75_001477 [Diaphorina citri]|nr:hypothetical protein M8J75_001477 [Diaphorina citri]